MLVRGKIVFLVMALLIVGAAGFSIWYNHHQSAQSIAFWGDEAVKTILQAEHVIIARCAPAAAEAPAAERITLAGQTFQLIRRKDMAQNHDLKAIWLEDGAFDWQTVRHPPTELAAQSLLAIEFQHGDRVARYAIDLPSGWVFDPAQNRAALLIPLRREEFQKFAADEFPP
ncbi:MAG TPA: hypothetical protein VFE24_12030 [Pirellulales bacterium]|jgi:hypothetical protein|nr:hypothetical protein [Pirellulales bacterium]